MLRAKAWVFAVSMVAHPAFGDVLTQTDGEFHLGGVELRPSSALRPLVLLAGAEHAWRFDGHSNWLESVEPVRLEMSEGWGVGAWVFLTAPPNDTAAVMHLNGADQGEFQLAVTALLRPEVRIGNLILVSEAPLALGEWAHVAADRRDGVTTLRVNGAVVGKSEGDVAPVLEGVLTVGRNPSAGVQDAAHPLGGLPGLLASVTLQSDRVEPGPSPATVPPLEPPPEWFAGDVDRPKLHPIGPTGWTNEPHALIFRDGLWHLYHQANPVGPFWRRIVWGHLVSPDLVKWQPRLPALSPSAGFDDAGVWVGNWIPDQKPPSVLYTGVNGQWAGLGIARVREDGSLTHRSVAAYETPLDFEDMRDPFVLRTDEGWLALLGAGIPGQSRPLIYAWRSANGTDWVPDGPFDIGELVVPGIYWELPMLVPVDERWVLFATPVVPDVPARTLYWIGDFDGRRFRADNPEPHTWDVTATYRAPTIAAGPDDTLISIGIIADELRDEPARHRAGWVHTLGLAQQMMLCPNDGARLCAAIAPAILNLFQDPVASEPSPQDAVRTFDLESRPSLLRATVAVGEAGKVRIGLRTSVQGVAAAELRIDLRSGQVVLDYSKGTLLPLSRPARIIGQMASGEEAEIALVIDGAAISGTLNGQPFGAMVFAASPEQNRLTLALDGEAEWKELEVHTWR